MAQAQGEEGNVSLTTLSRELDEVRSEIATRQDQHLKEMAALNERLGRLIAERCLLLDGLDLEKIKRAEQVMRFEGDPIINRHGDYPDQKRDSRNKAIADAVSALSAEDEPFSELYIGVKNYASFGDQREDHKYGYGPRHGDIVFRIGRRKQEIVFTQEDREACIYFLLKWKDIYKSRAAAKVA